jgi:hypothetical protein
MNSGNNFLMPQPSSKMSRSFARKKHIGGCHGKGGGIGLRVGVRWAIPVLGLVAALSPEPSLVHHDLRTLCPPGSRAALRGAPPECLHEAVQRSRAQLERILQRLREPREWPALPQ